jgi:hypothetical protein
MHLHDAYDDILTRKAEEAPGGIAPLNYSWTSPDYDPSKFVAPEGSIPSPLPAQITITAKKIPPVPAPIQIPLLQLVPTPAQPITSWDQIMANRAAMVPRPPLTSSWTRYLPWLAIAAAAAVALAMTGDKKAAPARRVSPTRRPSYARARRR